MSNWIYVYVSSYDSDRDAFGYSVDSEEDLAELIESFRTYQKHEFKGKGEIYISIFRNKPEVIKIPN